MFFNGQYRRRPEQNLGGSSHTLERDVLIQKAALERQQRQEQRAKLQALQVIQSQWRKCLVQQRLRISLRGQYDTLIANPDEELDFDVLFHYILYFYQQKIDSNRIISFGQIVIRNKERLAKMVVNDTRKWVFRLKSFVKLFIPLLEDNTLTVSLRVIEVLTDEKLYSGIGSKEANMIVSGIWSSLMSSKFLAAIRRLLDARVPEPFEETSRPPTPLASSVMDLLCKGLNCDYDNNSEIVVVTALLGELFSGPFSPQVKYFVIPFILSKRGKVLSLENILSCCSKNSPDIWILFCLLKLVSPLISTMSSHQKLTYTKVLRTQTVSLPSSSKSSDDFDEDEDEPAPMDIDSDKPHCNVKIISSEILSMINETSHVNALVSMMEESSESNEEIIHLTCLCYSLLTLSTQLNPVHEFRLLYTLAFRTEFLRKLWKYIANISTPSVFGPPTPLLHLLARGLPLAAVDWDHILPQLTLFTCLLAYILPTIDDVEFYERNADDENSRGLHMPFSLPELQSITTTLKDVCIGLVELAYHDTRISVSDDYKEAMKSMKGSGNDDHDTFEDVSGIWMRLFKSCVNLLRQLHHRDSRRPFCPSGHWISPMVSIPVERPTDFRAGTRQRRRYRHFVGLRRLTREELETGGPPLSATEIKNITILQEMPFVVSFIDRFKIFQTLIQRDKTESRGQGHHFLVPGSTIDIVIRRNYIYEDAFEKLSIENEPNIKKSIRVQLMNAVGLDEAGIDGGGIFREFLSELLKAAFDPNRGFFVATHDRLLFPNPGARLVCAKPEDCFLHFFFIGRMLGKALYENMLVELPFATFFLAKLLAKGQSSDVDVHHLATLDPTLYKNLIRMKNMDADSVSNLGLDFTVTNADFGGSEEVELKPGGKNTPVTASNRIEYIHLMADYRLNRQLRPYVSAFKQGLANVIDLDWIRMFSPKELQILISGTFAPIDVEDLKSHTKYSGGYEAEHPVIQTFWSVVSSFDEKHKRQLLKFVTSCSRPPLLGFKDLEPPFCIHSAGSDDRLPTASTCMNLLKLPAINDEKTLREKLLYAIEADVGFELS